MARRTSPRRITVWTCIIAGGIVVAGALGILALNHWVYTPQRPALEYLQAVGDGDSARALDLLHPKGLDSENRAALRDSVLSGAAELPENFELADTHELDDGSVRVTYRFTLDDSRQTTSFVAERGGRQWLVFNEWHLKRSSLPSVDVTVPGSSTVSVNGVGVEMAKSTDSLPMLYPAKYIIGYSSTYVRSSPQSVMVTSASDEPNPVKLTLSAKPALAHEVHRQIAAALKSCADSTVLAPSHCPFAVKNKNKILGRVSWKVDQVPTVDLTRSNGKWKMERATGEATASGRQMDIVTADKSSFQLTSRFEYSATVRISGDRVTVTPKFGG